jgi:cellobiose transport system substrate-binding protein
MHLRSTDAGRSHVPTRRQRLTRGLAAVLVLSVGGTGIAACGSDDPGDETITLTINLFGDFGYQPLYEKYQELHPNVTIEERVAEFAAHHTNLAQHLATNSGAADIEAVEVGYISQFAAQPQKFYNLLDYGAGALEDDYLPWKWKQGLSKDGSALIGLGTDVGGMAMCYRTDKFAQAGLPTDRDDVSALWPTWEDYITVGQQYVAAVSDSKFYDSSGNMFRAIVGQAPVGVYDTDDTIVVGTNPDIKDAWDTTVDAIEAGLSANIAAWTPEWNTGFAQGSFATIVCPAWMTAYIESQAADASGKWDIAKVPGGSGNMGGSHLVLPAQGDHPEVAADLVKFLLNAENQLAVFKDKGNFPSLPALYDDPTVLEFSKPFFNDAPLGEIFTAAALELEPQYEGPRAGDVMNAIGQGLGRVEQGQQAPDEAWQQVLSDVERIG